MLVINPQLPFKSVAELVAYAKANPGKLNYSTGGIGTLPHLNAELFKSVSGTNIVHVPYKGGGPALTGVVAGEVQMTFDTVSTSLQLIQDGRLRALADCRAEARAGIARRADHAGSRLSRRHQRRLDRAAGAARHAARHHRQAQRRHQRGAAIGEQMKSALAKLGAQPRGGTPQDLADHIQREVTKWKPIVAALHLKVD